MLSSYVVLSLSLLSVSLTASLIILFALSAELSALYLFALVLFERTRDARALSFTLVFAGHARDARVLSFALIFAGRVCTARALSFAVGERARDARVLCLALILIVERARDALSLIHI